MTQEPLQTRAFTIQCWISFLLSFGMSVAGLATLPLDPWMRAFVIAAYLFTINSSFALAKSLRDRHESRRLLHRLDQARAEEILRRFGEPAE